MSCSLLGLRSLMLMGAPPKFVPADNPAAASKSWATKMLTFNYLYAFHGWLLLCPDRLSADWAGASIALVESTSDPRNAATALLYAAGLVALGTLLLLPPSSLALRNDHDRRALIIGLAMVVVARHQQ